MKTKRLESWFPGSGKTFTSDERPSGIRLNTADRGPRLTVRDVEDLRYFFTEYEADAGQASTYGMALAAWAGLRGGGSASSDYHARPAELVDSGATRRANAVRRRLHAMCEEGDSRLVVVLYKMHGARHPAAFGEVFGELAPLAELTETVSMALREMAAREGRARAIHVDESYEDGAAAQVLAELQGDAAAARAQLERCTTAIQRWQAESGEAAVAARRIDLEARAARRSEQLAKVEAKLTVAPPAKRERLTARRAKAAAALQRASLLLADDGVARRLAAAERERASWKTHLRSVQARIDSFDETRVRSRATAATGAVAELTTADALRWRLDYHGKRDDEGHPDKDAHAAWKTARALFILAVRRDADALRGAAAAAWLATRPA